MTSQMSRHNQDVVRRLAGGATLAEKLDPALPQVTLPHRMDPLTAELCWLSAEGRRQARQLARVAPWLYISRPAAEVDPGDRRLRPLP